ncbi:pilus assembly protein TadE [Noviherbaspirillum cavernae]|uniref:Pilus assembly protein TadE n=2 Tax=Noviherbaspirillum cavernae TaxID=2320862 RepID=A0A418WWK8_9BURK|nr:pilus assembly protein TadE [Noviherbaspirillum cavernae]
MPGSRRNQKGAAVITVSFWFIALIGMTALAFDIGHLLIVRNELQNAADAAALAGANCLDKTTAVSGTDCTNTASATLNWTMARTKASNSIGFNKSDSKTLVNGTVETGYWNVNGGTTMQATTLTPIGPCTVVSGVMTTACDKPAVRVTLSRTTGSNGGAVGTLIATMFGGAAIPITASAVAVRSAPGQVMPGSLIPMTINKCMFDLYWDSTTNTPRNATTESLKGVPQVIGQPWVIRIGSSYHYPNCESGQWTSFTQDVNDVPTVRDLINNGNPDPLSIGQDTWIEPGTKSSLYDTLDDKYPTPPGANVTVLVVDRPSGLDSKGTAPIVAFAGFHINDVNKQGKYIQGHFIKEITVTTGSSGIGPSYGIYTPPRLAQ